MSLGRAKTTLSGGESQRIKMVRHLGGRHANRARVARTTPDAFQPAPTLRLAPGDRQNLQDVDVDFPTGVLTVVTGMAGINHDPAVSLSSVHEDDQVGSRGQPGRRGYPHAARRILARQQESKSL